MGCRKNQATLTATERAAFVAAVKALKTKPSQLSPPTANRYDDYVETHRTSMTGGVAWAHRRPAFLPWHRAFLRQFELDLQAIDPTVSLPYWDWTVDNSPTSSIWNADFMGGNGTGAQSKVTTGPFREGQWALADGSALVRAFGARADAPTLPTAQNVQDCIDQETVYDSPPWDDDPNCDGFRNRSEGWTGAGSVHNRVHLWVGGSMLPATSPNDPVFFLHHCNVDRLWARWQRKPGAPSYAPADGTPTPAAGIDLVGHRPSDSMQPWGGTTTVASTFDHHALGYWYDDEPPEVDLLTPSLAFQDVPEGVGGVGLTTYRAVLFEVRSCAPVTFEVLAGPTPPFGLSLLGSSVIVPSAHEDQPAIGRLWIAYTSTTAGATAVGSVTVGQVGTAEQWVISLTANTIARPRSSVTLALDRSGSMAEPAGDGFTKVAKLKQAVSAFVDVMREGDGLGIVSFDDVTARLTDVVDVGPQPAVPGSGRALAATVLSGPDLDPRGATGIGAAVVEAADALADAQATASPPYDVQAMLVLTDGNENVDPKIGAVASSITARSYAVGLGTPANVSTAALSALAHGTGGYMLVTGALTQDQTFRLSKYFLQVLAGVTNTQIVVDPAGDLVAGPTHRIPFPVTEADYGLDVIVLSPLPAAVEFALETPDGTIVTPATAGTEPAVTYVAGRAVTYYRLALPALGAAPGGSHAGRWRALLRLASRPQTHVPDDPWRKRGALPYSVIVQALSTLELHGSVRVAGEVEIDATLTEYGVPVTRAELWAEVTGPGGSAWTVRLSPVDTGWAGGFRPRGTGLHTIRLRAAGSTLRGTPFRREVTLTATVGPLPDTGTPATGSDDLCRLLECLLDRKVTGQLVDELLERYGGSRDALAECVRKACADRGAGRREPRAVQRAEQPPVRRPVERAAGHPAGHGPAPEPEPAPPEPPDAPAPAPSPSPEPGTVEFGRLVEAEPVARPPQEHDHEGPMFGLSNEDLAELGLPLRQSRKPGTGPHGGGHHV